MTQQEIIRLSKISRAKIAAYEKSARALDRANRLRERGMVEKEETKYAKAEYWLVRFNELNGEDIYKMTDLERVTREMVVLAILLARSGLDAPCVTGECHIVNNGRQEDCLLHDKDIRAGESPECWLEWARQVVREEDK